MNKVLKIVLTGLLFFFAKSNFYSQQIQASNAAACPGQAVVITATWSNVGSVTYTITRPAGTATIQSSPSFTVSSSTVGTVVYTIVGNGTALSGPVSSTTTATLTVAAPSPITLTNTVNYCYGSTVNIQAPPGSVNYTVTGPIGGPVYTPFNTSSILIPNVTSPTYNGVYSVAGNYAGCVRTGTTQVNVSPNSQITVNAPVNVCQGSSANLTSALAAGTGYTWLFQGNPFASVQNTLMTNLQPSQSGTYSVTANFIYNGIQCPRTATTSITVVPTSTVTIGASPSAILCQGGNLNLTANVNTTPGTPPGFSWSGPSFASSSQNPSIGNVTPANSGAYHVTALFFNAAITCTTGATVNMSVVATVDPNPSGPPNVCQNSPLSLSVTAPGAISFVWIGPNANYTSSVQYPTFPSVQPDGTGTYFVTANFAIGSVTCPRTKSITVNVIPVNTITVFTPPPACFPDNVTLQASAIGATSFTWEGSGGPVGYVNNLTLFHPQVTASGIYTVTAGFTSGNLTCYNTNTVSVIIQPLLNFSLQPSQLVCYNSTVHIAGPAGATSYNWTSTSGYVATTQNIDLNSVQPSSSGTYSLQVSLNGCITSGTTSIEVLSPIQYLQPFFDRTICKGDTIHMEAPIVGGSGNYAYTWFPNYAISPINSSVTVGTPDGTTNYNVIAHDIACPSYSITGSILVTVNQPPSSDSLVLPKNEGCSPLCMHYDAHSGPGTAWVIYDFGANLKYQQNAVDVCLTTGIYTLNITATGTNGCTGSTVFPLPIYVYPTPTLDIATIPDSPTINDNPVFTTNGDKDVTSYLWVFNNVNASGEPDTSLMPRPQKTFDNSGSYPVLLIGTTDMGCADTVYKVIQIREDFNVFIPNTFTPNGDDVNDLFQIKGSGMNPDKFSMDLVDRKGATLFSTTDLSAGWDGVTNGSKVQPGVYVYKIIVVGMHGEGKKEYIGQFSLIR